jgi:phosphoribosylformimino-5-aminoimidazole carboxamide ribotide isomerase
MTMVHAIEIFPAVDLKDGRCVRLKQGRMDAVDVYGDDPVAVAARWAADGAAWLHVVDLDGAVGGRPVNREVIERILDRVPIKIQVGGGIRTIEQMAGYLDHGAARVVLGTSVIEQPEVIRQAVARFPGRIVVSLDAKDDELYVDGWTRSSGRRVAEVAQQLKLAGVTQLILTDIRRDGMLRGVDLTALRERVAALPLPVIIAGGVSTLDDLAALRRVAGVNGAIIGKALYTGAIDLKAALDCAQGKVAR